MRITSLLQRYIAKTIILATFLVSVIFFAVLLLVLLLGELKNVGQGDYGVMQMLLYVFLKLPNQVYSFSPLLVLLGSIVGLSILTTHRELAVMRASGFSTNKIIYSVLSAAIFLVLLFSVIGELFAPHLSYKAEMNKENARNAGQAVLTTGGVWFHVNNNFIHVQNVVNKQLLRAMTRYEFDENYHLRATYYAKSLTFKEGHWMMNNGVKTSFSPESASSLSFKHADLGLTFNPNLLNIGLIEASEMSLTKLYKFTDYLKLNQLQSSEYQYNFWQRVLQPFVSLLMVFLSIPFVLSVFRRANMGRQIFIGLIAGFGFYILNSVIGQLCIVYQLPPYVAAMLPLLIFAGIGLSLTKLVNLH